MNNLSQYQSPITGKINTRVDLYTQNNPQSTNFQRNYAYLVDNQLPLNQPINTNKDLNPSPNNPIQNPSKKTSHLSQFSLPGHRRNNSMLNPTSNDPKLFNNNNQKLRVKFELDKYQDHSLSELNQLMPY